MLGLAIALAGPASAGTAHSAATPRQDTANGTFGIGPANAKGLDGRGDLNYTVQPGSRSTDYVAVHNYGAIPLTLHIYAADATSSGNAAIGFRPRADTGPDASTWITFPGGAHQLTIEMAPRTVRILEFTIALPAGASPGDHLAGIIASLVSKVVGGGSQGQNTNLEQGVAVRAFFRVSGDIRALLSIEHLHVAYHGNLDPIGTGSATVTYIVRNAGNVDLGGTQRISVTGLFGSTGANNLEASVPLLLPGATFPVTVKIKHIWPELLMHARVTVTPLAVAGAVDQGMHATSASISFWAIPWTLLIAIVVLLALIVVGLVWRRRRPKRGGGGHRSKGKQPDPALAGTR